MSRFFAPGKVVVLGEYAVVDGAPAIVAAVDHGVAVRFVPGPVRVVHTPYADSRFVDAALDAALAPTGTWQFTDHPARTTADKPGLGGSASATVVAVHAARAARGLPEDRDATWALATEVHHHVQGSGSCIDVAASTYGGAVRFVRGERPTGVPCPSLSVVASGRSAKTGPRVERYRAWDGRAAFCAESAALTDAFAADPIGAVRASRRLLERMAEAAGLDYRTDALDRLGDLAESFGGGGKPSGAGGGDSLIAVFPDDQAREAFEAAARALGFLVLDARVDPGVRALPPDTPVG